MRYRIAIVLTMTLLVSSIIPAFGSQKKELVLESVVFHQLSGKGEAVTFRLNGEKAPKIFMLSGSKPRIVVDFLDTRCSLGIKQDMTVNSSLVKRIRVGIHTKPVKTRVVIDLVPNEGGYKYAQHFDTKEHSRILTIYRFGEKTLPKKVAKKAAMKHREEMVAGKSVKKAGSKTVKAKPTAVKKTVSVAKKTKPSVIAAKKTMPAAKKMQESTKAETNKKIAKTEKPVVLKKTAKSKPKAAVVKKTIPMLSRITFEKDAQRGEMVLFQLNGFFPPDKVFGIEKGHPRVICDFSKIRLGERVKDVLHCNGKFVESVLVTRYAKSDKVRVTLNLVPKKNYDLQQVFFKQDKIFALIVKSRNKQPPMKKTTAAR